MTKIILTLICIPLLTGCATQFMGDAHVTRPYCENFCKKNDLEFTGMVALGEYSSGCICAKPKSEKAMSNPNAAAAGAAAAGVMMTMRARENMSLIGASAAMQH
jgi:hypothetical protein